MWPVPPGLVLPGAPYLIAATVVGNKPSRRTACDGRKMAGEGNQLSGLSGEAVLGKTEGKVKAMKKLIFTGLMVLVMFVVNISLPSWAGRCAWARTFDGKAGVSQSGQAGQQDINQLLSVNSVASAAYGQVKAVPQGDRLLRPTLPPELSKKLFGDKLKTAKRELFRTATSELPKSPWDYLRPGPWDPYWDIPSDDPEITGLVQEITRGLTSDKEKAAAIYKWVVQNIKYDYSYSIYEALPTLHARKGVCNGFSLLLAAMMRAGGIPAKFVTGAADGVGGWPRLPEKTNHAWNEIYIDGKWYSVDVTWDSCRYHDLMESHLEYPFDYYLEYYLIDEKQFSADHHKILVNADWFDYQGEELDLELSCSEAGAKIFYTLDLSEPTSNSTLYSTPLHITNGTTIKAIAVVPQGVVSYVEIPFIYINEGVKFFDSQRGVLVDIPLDRESQQIYAYFLNGQKGNYIPGFIIAAESLNEVTVWSQSPLGGYWGSSKIGRRIFDLKEGGMRVTISKGGEMLEIDFTVYSLPPDFQKPRPPLSSVSPGRYDRPLDVSLDCPRAEDNPWSAIYYTTDGSVPGPGTARLWDGKPVHIAADTTVKAVAVLGNWDYVSDVAELKYEIRLSDYYAVAEDMTALAIGFAPGDSSTSVTRDLTLPVQGKYGSTIRWQSDRPEIISEDGKVSRPVMPRWLVERYLSGENPIIEERVSLTATVTRGNASDTKEFTLVVPGRCKLADTCWAPVGAIGDGAGALWGVAAGGNLWLAVGDHGAIYTSPDGFSWTKQDAGTRENLRAVAFNGRMWVAVGEHFLVSRDGVKWDVRSASVVNPYLVGVAGSSSLWVAISHDGFIFTSPDGYVWERRDLNEKGPRTFNAIAWNGKMWIIAGDKGLILTSSDGLNWTEQVSGTTGSLRDVAWDGSRWVVTGQNEVLTSSDGVVWKRYDCLDAPVRIAWGGSQWVGIPSFSGNGILTSLDGTSWDRVIKDPTGFPSGQVNDIASWDHRCVAVGERGVVHVIDSIGFPDPGLEAAVRKSLNKPLGAITREDIKGLQQLDASQRNIADLARLEFAINLVSLNLAGNRIESIREIENLQNLKYLNLAHNNIRDISPLVKNSEQGGLGWGAVVDLRDNPLDLEEGSQAYQDIARLISRGVTVKYGNDREEDDAREWAPQVNVPPNKVWTIKFNMPVDPGTITIQNISVKDASGNVVNVTVEMGNDGRSVIVKPPPAGYTPGQVYTLYIGRGIKSTSGLNLKNAVKMQFIIGAGHLTY
ncbi:transglutaminase domain-containing protein [Desulfofundulus kuznetsovii DSM 6115]|uniref:Transglutaminase domain-containing protein n=2 Tax=Desulfofundulus kuznetsovii TaxID=58135 RepID=A0AAU8PQV0_DESK7|nr:transglutaminase domain-containing protein [Desulfofundulus kuznetsovii DSM 6115]